MNDQRWRLGYLPGVDGLRAVSVIAVFLFHAGVVDGGFLGVDVFFVISGYLITGLALREIDGSGGLALGRFWARRARRLLPALFALVAAVVVVGLADPSVPRASTRDVVSTLAYVANIVRASDGYEYFAAYEEPSLLEHTWSLAVEEQFYVVWPLVVVGVVAVARRLGRPIAVAVGSVAGAAAVASTAWAWWSASVADVALNRLYFGTDTRAVGLAVGCVAGCVHAGVRQPGSRRIGAVANTAAIVGAVALAVMVLTIDGGERWLYGPGFALAALASVALVNAAAGVGPIRDALAWGPLPAIGRVSYGVYLWHWPVIVVLDADRTGLSGPVLGGLWVTVTAALTAASWWLIERPAPLPTVQRPLRALGYTGVAVVVGLVPIVVSAAEDDGVEAIVVPTVRGAPENPAGAVPEPSGGSPVPASPSGSLATTAPPGSSDAPRGSSAAPPVTEAAPATEAPPVTEALPPTTSAAPAPAAGPITLLVLGDSVAESLGQAPATLAADLGRNVVVENRAIVACSVIREGRWVFDGGQPVSGPPECAAEDRFESVVADVGPDVVLLWFGWPGTIAGRELADGELLAACDPRFDRAYGDDLVELVDRLGSGSGPAVVVATVAPPGEFRDPSQVDRPGCLNREIRDRDLAVFDYGGWLCPGGDCSSSAGLRRDAVHFSSDPELQARIWPVVVEQVLAAAGI